jgi:hypothetical protein
MPQHDETFARPASAGRDHRLRNFRWFAAEIVVVVVGILIAMALNSWWSGRQDAERAASYLGRIHEDLLSDADALAKHQAYFAGVQRFGEDAITYVETGALRNGSAWHTLVAFFHAGNIWPYASNTRTYVEMQNAGDLRLIRDSDLRAELATYYDASEVSQGSWIFGEIPAYRARIRGLTPIPIQRYLFDACSREDSCDNQVLLDCDAPSSVSEAEARAVLERFIATPGLLEDLRYWVSTLIVSDIVMRLTRDVATKLAEQALEQAGR